MRIVVPLVLACFAALPSVEPASAARDDRLSRDYARVSAGAFEAQDHCPGLVMDLAGLAVLREAAHLGSDKDDQAFLRARWDEIKPGMERDIAKSATAWCKAAYGTFGPSGLRVLRRE